jgi:pilus assembly protein Flp/PilA
MKRYTRLWSDDAGATAVEYGLVAALIVVAILGGVNLFAANAVSMFDYSNVGITAAMR